MSFNGKGRYNVGASGFIAKGIEGDKAMIEVIEKLPPPMTVKGIRSFLGHTGFYKRFIKNFSKIPKPLYNLLIKENQFHFDKKKYEKAFFCLKRS